MTQFDDEMRSTPYARLATYGSQRTSIRLEFSKAVVVEAGWSSKDRVDLYWDGELQLLSIQFPGDQRAVLMSNNRRSWIAITELTKQFDDLPLRWGQHLPVDVLKGMVIVDFSSPDPNSNIPNDFRSTIEIGEVKWSLRWSSTVKDEIEKLANKENKSVAYWIRESIELRLESQYPEIWSKIYTEENTNDS